MMSYQRRRPIVLAFVLALAAFAAYAATPDDCEAPRPAWCQEGYGCVPSGCLATLRVERDDALAENMKLRATRQRWFSPWANVGLEYDFNDTTYRPYGLAGVTLWRHVNVWGGTFGDKPAAGAGWVWTK